MILSLQYNNWLGKFPKLLAKVKIVTEQEAIKIASKHIAQRNREHSVFSEAHIGWKVTDPIEHSDFWYFEYEFETLSNKDVMIAGAPGYAVSKLDGSIRSVSWEEYSKLTS